jgi:hypothetical protein
MFIATRTKVKGKLVPVQPMEAHGGVEVWFHPFLTSRLHAGKWPASRPSLLTTPAEEFCYPPNRRLGGAPKPVCRVPDRESSALT